MDGQGHYKHARETGDKMLLDEYKKRSLKAKKGRSILVIEIVAVCVEGGACRNR
jgi:hypothetical protein